jgi:7-keto-8-aminopelargonate synthetase-like enzyme
VRQQLPRARQSPGGARGGTSLRFDEHGYGMASVRFICGTQSVHRELESGSAAFLGMEDTILYSSCFDANGGLFETLLGRGRGDLRCAQPRQHHRRHPLCKAQRCATPTTT